MGLVPRLLPGDLPPGLGLAQRLKLPDVAWGGRVNSDDTTAEGHAILLGIAKRSNRGLLLLMAVTPRLGLDTGELRRDEAPWAALGSRLRKLLRQVGQAADLSKSHFSRHTE